jgi:hypothetical protein
MKAYTIVYNELEELTIAELELLLEELDKAIDSTNHIMCRRLIRASKHSINSILIERENLIK